jgi:hypothetical protein
LLNAAPPALPASPLWLPFAPGPYRPAMGLIARPLAELTAFGADYPAQMAERRALLDLRRGEVFAVLPGSEAARREALRVIAGHLRADRAAWFAEPGGMLENRLTGERWNLAAPEGDPLECAGRLVQEDLCLLDPDSAALTAAVLCFPSRWRLADKLGRELAAIHARVPLYAERLERPVARFIAALAPGRLVERFNWTIHDGSALFQPEADGAHGPAVTAETAPARLHLRVERQTLSRLPETGAVLFTIRTRQVALAEVVTVAGAAAALAAAVRGLPESVAAYRGIAPFRAALLAALDRVAPQG